ncbi:MAG: TRAP transporter small permease, partial [Hydrogenophaga sp.]
AIMWLTVVDVSGRKFLSNSVPGALEITEILMVVVIFGALPLVSWHNEHVTFDSFDAFFPAWLRRLQARLVNALCAAVFGFLGQLMIARGDRFSEYGDTTAYLLLPVAPVAYLMAGLLFVTAVIHAVLAVVPRPVNASPAHGQGDVA